jgi:hypothetical protein
MFYRLSVKIKEGKIGGSAFGKKPKKGLFGFGLIGRHKKDSSNANNALSERSDGDHVYALKSILLDRVSPVFIQELLNEGMCICHVVGSLTFGSLLSKPARLFLFCLVANIVLFAISCLYHSTISGHSPLHGPSQHCQGARDVHV